MDRANESGEISEKTAKNRMYISAQARKHGDKRGAETGITDRSG